MLIANLYQVYHIIITEILDIGDNKGASPPEFARGVNSIFQAHELDSDVLQVTYGALVTVGNDRLLLGNPRDESKEFLFVFYAEYLNEAGNAVGGITSQVRSRIVGGFDTVWDGGECLNLSTRDVEATDDNKGEVLAGTFGSREENNCFFGRGSRTVKVDGIHRPSTDPSGESLRVHEWREIA